MRYTNIFPNPEDDGFLRLTIDSNPEEHLGYSKHVKFNPEVHQQIIEGKWDLEDGEIIIRFIHIRGRRTITVVRYQEDSGFNCKIDDHEKEGDYHIEVNGKRVKEHIKIDKNVHPALFCLLRVLEELAEIKEKNIPVYFFFEEQMKKRPDILNLLVENRPKDVTLVTYCYAVASVALKNERVMNLRVMDKWIEKQLLPAIKEVNETFQKDGFVNIFWTNEQRIFPIPVGATNPSQITLEFLGKKNPKIPRLFSFITNKETHDGANEVP